MGAYQPIIVLPEEIETEFESYFCQDQKPAGILYGVRHPGEGVYQVRSIAGPIHEPFSGPMGYWCVGQGKALRTKVVEGKCLLLLRRKQGQLEVKGYVRLGRGLVPLRIERFSQKADLLARAQAILDTDKLLGKTVAFVGLGSVGSVAALWLAQSGLGCFKLFDPKRISPANISRHVCDLYDLCRFKTLAMKEKILNRNPKARVESYEEDICNLDEEDLEELVGGSDLILATTDYSPAQFRANIVSVKTGIPAVFVGCYDRACGGEIIFSIPESSSLSSVYGRTACYECVVGFRKKAFKPLPEDGRSVPYSEVEDPAQMKAEPGLAIDISYVTATAMPYVLALLDPTSSRRALVDRERNLIFVGSGNVPEWEFRQPFDYFSGKTSINPNCPSCGTEEKFMAMTGRSDEEVRQANREIISQIFKEGSL